MYIASQLNTHCGGSEWVLNSVAIPDWSELKLYVYHLVVCDSLKQYKCNTYNQTLPFPVRYSTAYCHCLYCCATVATHVGSSCLRERERCANLHWL
jgi:hypothetical protein